MDNDGQNESIYLDGTKMMPSNFIVTLSVHDQKGRELWNDEFAEAHAGWNQLFLTELDGRQYLLRYIPSMYQGFCTYVYSLFTIENGKEKVLQANTLEFDINGTRVLDADKMMSFAAEINALLKKSALLVSSDGGNFRYGLVSTEPYMERYSWLDGMPELYSPGDDLKTRLAKYSKYAIANRERRDGQLRYQVTGIMKKTVIATKPRVRGQLRYL